MRLPGGPPSSSGSRFAPSNGLASSAGARRQAASIVGSQSQPWTGVSITPPAGIRPGQATIPGCVMLLLARDADITLSVSFTTRAPRPGDQNGREYHFVGVEEFKQRRETLRAELARGGYKLVDEAGPDTLRVTAAIVDLYVTAPDTMTAGRSRTYTANSGRMTLVAELRDSVTGELLARAVDARSARTAGSWGITNRVTNTADARRAMGIWATALRQALDDMYGRAQAG